MGRPTIAELEEILNQTDDRKIRIEPDGSVREMSESEFRESELAMERGRNELLRKEINRLRDKLKDIAKLAEAL